MEIDKLEKIIQSEVLAETDVDEMISKKSSSFDKERINDSYHSIRKRIDAIVSSLAFVCPCIML